MVTLEGVHAKIQRAENQIEQLSREIANSCETQRSLFAEELRPEVGDKIWIFRGETPIVPIEYSIRLGEIVYNLRSSLDQLIWQLVHANYKIPNHRNEFPMFDDESRFNKAEKTKLAGISLRSLARIKEMQPFRKNDEWSALKTVHSLCNIDKHRSVILPFYMLDRSSATYLGGGIPDVRPLIRSFISSQGPELRKNEIANSVQPPDPAVEIKLFVDMKLEGSNSLDPKKYADTDSDEQQVILVLRDCLSTVQKAIDCLSDDIQEHPLFGRRPPLCGLKAVDVSVNTSDPLIDDMVRRLFRDLGEF